MNIIRFKRFALLILLSGIFCSCNESLEIPQKPLPEPVPEEGSRTVLAYIAADNSLTSFSLKDLNEMIEGMELVNTQENTMLVYIDRYEIKDRKRILAPQLIRICRNTDNSIMLDTLQTYDVYRNSMGVEEMKEVCSYAFGRFPAKGYGLILWSHGDGWIPFNSPKSRWIGQDTDAGGKDKRMDIDKLHEVLKDISYHLDFLFFDACYMQSIEVAYELKDFADYFIGSPTEIPGPGAPYQRVMPFLFAKLDAAVRIAESYYGYYNEIYKAGVGISDDNWTGGVSISVLKSDALDALAAITSQIPLYTSGWVNTSGIKCYDSLREKNYYDMDAFMRLLAADDALYQSWKDAYNAAVVYAKTTEMNYNTSYSYGGRMVSMEGFTGVSTYILANKASSYYKTLAWYTASGG